MKTTLIVEDNPRFMAAAMEYIRTGILCRPAATGYEIGDIYAHCAADHERAVHVVDNIFFEQAIIDCFFPMCTGSGDTSLGQELITKMMGEDSEEVRISGCYEFLQGTMQASEANQPLGLDIAEKIYRANRPFVLVTSAYYPHAKTIPIRNYAERRGWVVVDRSAAGGRSKDSPEFWAIAFRKLEERTVTTP